MHNMSVSYVTVTVPANLIGSVRKVSQPSESWRRKRTTLKTVNRPVLPNHSYDNASPLLHDLAPFPLQALLQRQVEDLLHASTRLG